MGDDGYTFLCRWYAFLRWVIDRVKREGAPPRDGQGDKENRRPEPVLSNAGTAPGTKGDELRSWESLMFLFQWATRADNRRCQQRRNNDRS